MSNLPSGTVTFLFTDIEGSTKLARQYPDVMLSLLARHHEILNESFRMHGGYAFQSEGDSFAVAFHSANDALNAALAAQQSLHHESWWPAPIKVRMGIHTGAAQLNDASAPIVYSGYIPISLTQRIMSAGHGGQILVSGATESLLRDQLPKDIDLLDMGEHDFKDVLQPVRVFQVIASGLPEEFPPLRTLSILPNNLPAQLSKFIGREKEIEQIKKRLEQYRLVTLTGSGGVGKTRLSIQVALELLAGCPQGVWFVELAPVTNPALVPQAVCTALDLTPQGNTPALNVLKDYLRSKKLLLVIDNCEHLLDACAQLAEALLQACPNLRILASSREALGIDGESAYRVPSLSLADPKSDLHSIKQSEAVQLFIERASAVLPGYALMESNAPTIAQICQRLDGIALAIVLAASRVKLFKVDQIAARLDDAFRLLTGGSRTALPRQQTLRGTIDWSYNLLTEEERSMFRRLSVFVGGWTLEGAESICGDGNTLDLLIHLVDKSLVAVDREHGNEARYYLLETIRQYTREKLFETEEAAQIRDHHLDYFRRLAEKAEIEIMNSNQVAWLQRLDTEFANIRAAFEWSQQNRVEDGLRLGSAIWRFCLRYGYTNELVEKLNQLLNHPQGSRRTLARAKTLCLLPILAVWQSGQSDSVRERARAEEGLAIYKELGNQAGEAAGLYALGVGQNRRGDPDALSFLLQSLELYRSLNDKTDICDVLIVISQVSNDPTQRQACLEEALALARARGDGITMAGALDNLGILAMDLGNFPQARAWLEESLEIQIPLGAQGYMATLQYLSKLAMYEGNLVQARAYCNEVCTMSKKAGMTRTWQYIYSLTNLGYIALQEGDIALGKEMLGLSIQQFQKVNDLSGVVYAVECLASLHVNQRQLERAARLFAWADAMREEIGDHRPPVEQVSVEGDLEVIRSKLDNDEYAKLSTEGSTMTTEQATALALEEYNAP